MHTGRTEIVHVSSALYSVCGVLRGPFWPVGDGGAGPFSTASGPLNDDQSPAATATLIISHADVAAFHVLVFSCRTMLC